MARWVVAFATDDMVEMVRARHILAERGIETLNPAERPDLSVVDLLEAHDVGKLAVPEDDWETARCLLERWGFLRD